MDRTKKNLTRLCQIFKMEKKDMSEKSQIFISLNRPALLSPCYYWWS